LGSPLGAAIGFPLLIYLVATFGWRSAFYIVGLLNLLIVVPLLLTIVRDWPHNVSQHAVETHRRSFREVLRDSRIFLTDWRFWALTVSDCGALMYLWGLSSWLPTYLQRERHFDLQHLGIYSSLPFILSVCGQVLTGIVIDRTNRAGWLCFVGCFMAGVFTYLGANASEATTAAILIACSGGFFGMWAIAVYVLMRKIIPDSAFAAGAGTINGIANAAGSTAPIIVGFVISLTSNFSSGLLVMVIAPILGSFPLLGLIRRY
jgi:predicted MFS family arabinose efflux permease